MRTTTLGSKSIRLLLLAMMLSCLAACTTVHVPRYTHERVMAFGRGDAAIRETFVEHTDEKPADWPW